jgi:hypothetical protein
MLTRFAGRRARTAWTVVGLVLVPSYLSSAIGKTGTRTRAEAYALAERNGWL